MPPDHYTTLAAPAEFRQKIERSEFLALAAPVAEEPAFFESLQLTEKRFFDATHHCWAFRFFAGGDVRQRSSDAGEPSGTAGKPILSAIESAELFDTAVIVVRWYGGVKLGTGGLGRAYRDTAAQALAAGRTAERYLYTDIRVTVPFDAMNMVYRLVDPPHILLKNEAFGEENVFTVAVRRSRVDEISRLFTSKRLLHEITPP